MVEDVPNANSEVFPANASPAPVPTIGAKVVGLLVIAPHAKAVV